MRVFHGVAALALLIILPGCGLELLGTTAITTELHKQNAEQAVRTLEHVQGTTSRMTAERGIQAYQAERGENPPSLEALVQQGYLASIPLKADGTPYGYDPATGQLLDNPAPVYAPAPVTPPVNNKAALTDIRAALFDYYKDHGAYPASLQALVPDYLDRLPKSGGKDFLYNPATGQVSPPQAGNAYGAAQPAPQYQSQRQYGGGGSVAGEAITGMGVQQELNRMNSSGANAAGSRARQNARDMQNRGDQHVDQAMDQLGL